MYIKILLGDFPRVFISQNSSIGINDDVQQGK